MVETRGTIVVGIDGSEHAEKALRWALAEARLRDARVRIVVAWHLPTVVAGATDFVRPLAADAEATWREVAEEIVADAAGEAAGEGVPAETRVVRGQAADVLVEAAAGADLLVVGSRGRGGFGSLLLGSVGAQCAHHAPCPLVIVR
jgi:nucleotide-binding universal stress UspA family protein